MEASFILRCLGRPELTTGTGQPIRFKTRKHLALLTYLAVEPRRVHPRDRLAELLWPQAPFAEGRHSLATAISILRAKLAPDAFESGRDHLRFVLDDLTLDLDRLAAGDLFGDEYTPGLDVSGFLEDFEIAGAETFSLWREQQRARLQPGIREALVRLIDRCRRTADSRTMERLADRLLVMDDLSEDGIRAKMEARAFAGDRLSALRIFEAWKGKLIEELDAVPSELVEGIALRLRRRGWERTGHDQIPSVHTDQWKGRAFVGRTAEYRTLYEAWERTRDGDGRHLLLIGDSGIGKTTLVQRLLTAAGLEGAITSRVQCQELEREIPYAAVSSLVSGLLDRPGASATSPEMLAELARTIPEVRRRFPAIPEALDTQGETARLRLSEAVLELLGAVAEEHPVILVVDDLHLTDDASVAVLHLVMRRAERKRLMVVMSARPGEFGEHSNARKLWENAARVPVALMEIIPLTEEESAEMLDALLPPEVEKPTPGVRRALLKAAGGYPMVMELMVGDWVTRGGKSFLLSLDAITETLEAPDFRTDPYRQLLQGIIHGLDPAAKAVLTLSSVLGGRLNELELYAVVDLTIAQAIAGLSRLAELRVLRDGGRGMEFTNELVRAAAYASVPPTLRRALHDEAYQLLKLRQTGQPATFELELAWHAMRSGSSSLAVNHLLSGAKRALISGAPSEAERSLASAMSSLQGESKSAAILLLAEALHEQERYEDLLSLMNCEGERCGADAQELVALYRLTASFHLGIHAYNESEQVIQQFESLARLERTPIRIRVHAALAAAKTLELLRQPVASQSFIHVVDDLLCCSLGSDERAMLLLAKSIFHYQIGDESTSRTVLGQAEALLTTIGHFNSVLNTCRLGFGVLNMVRGRYLEALPHLLLAHQGATRLCSERGCATIELDLALLHLRLGDYPACLNWGRSLFARQTTPSVVYLEVSARIFVATALVHLGKTQEALAELAAARTRAGRNPQAWIRQLVNLRSADVLLLAGHREEAFRVAQSEFRDWDQPIEANSHAGVFARWLVLLTISEGRSAEALPRIQRMSQERSRYDFIDQVEILVALSACEMELGQESSTTRLDSENGLQALPAPCAEMILRLAEANVPTPAVPSRTRYSAGGRELIRP